MLRLSFTCIAAATLLVCLDSLPVNAQNASQVGARWGYSANGFNGPSVTGVRSFAVRPRPVGAGIHGGRYNVYRDRSGFGLRQTLTLNPGWGCHTCGFKNGPRLSGLHDPAEPGRAVTAVTLPSGDIIDLR